ncbi:MAG: hypothetical protein PHP44_15660, partial [Kiritimatiellae bacterium]|nr:hypothetical protein [Kiritimatiellia bacterium]
MKRYGFTLVGWLMFTSVVFASARLDGIQRRMVSLNNSYYTEATWMELMNDLDAIRADASARGALDEAVAAGLLQARAYVDLRDDQARAFSLLEKLKI